MAEEVEIVRHFSTLEEAEVARQYLEDNNLRPMVQDEAHLRGSGDRGVYALMVPAPQVSNAEELLNELLPTDGEEAVEMMEDWEAESEEMREKFEQI